MVSGAPRPPDYEEPYYWTTGAGFYQGKYPPWFDLSDSPVASTLEENYDAIKAEVLDFYETRRGRLRPNWLQWGYVNEGWLTIDLYSFGMRAKRNCEEFPFLDALVRQIPGMTSTQVAVLQPHTSIRPHIGETNAIMRCHLPLVVPGAAPDLGMRVGAETRCWEEGKVFALNIAYRHRAWNLTDKPRVIVVVDYINPDYADRQHEVESNALATTVMKGVTARFPVLKRMPVFVTRPTQFILAQVFFALGFLERRFGLSWSSLVSRRPAGRRRPLPGGPATQGPASDPPVAESVSSN